MARVASVTLAPAAPPETRDPEVREEFVWPPPEEELLASFDDFVVPVRSSAIEGPAAAKNASDMALPNDIVSAVAPKARGQSLTVPRWASWSVLIACSALVGGSVAWFTSPAAPPVPASVSVVPPVQASQPVRRARPS
jgi:hypothetical protein